MWNKLAIWWWRRHKVCVFCNDSADFYYSAVPICEFCSVMVGDLSGGHNMG